MPTKRSSTMKANDGASSLRSNAVAFFRRRIREFKARRRLAREVNDGWRVAYWDAKIESKEEDLLYMQSTDDRASAKKGGLGRK